MIKEMIDAYTKARQFEMHLKILHKDKIKEDTYKVHLTKEQMDLLLACYCYGITNKKQIPEEPPKNSNVAYTELLMEVCSKFQNETRHQTALRYIREAENKEGSNYENNLGS